MKNPSAETDVPYGSIELISEPEAAALLNMTPLMLARRRRAGKIGAIKDGHVIAYTLQHLAEYQLAFQRKGRTNADLDTKTLIKILRERLGETL